MAELALQICGAYGVKVGELRWDPEVGAVSGYMADKIREYGKEPWIDTPQGIGDPTRPALQSNDGFIALLAAMGLSTPDLQLINELLESDDPPNSIC